MSLAVCVFLSFRDEKLRLLCNRRALLQEKFGEHSDVVARRLLVLAAAERLKDIPTRPPDRRRFEQKMGPRMFSVSVRGAGRLYFEAQTDDDAPDALEAAEAVEIVSIGWRT